MRWSDIPFDPAVRTLRQFAGLCALFGGGIGLWQGWMHGRTTLGWGLAVAGLAIGLLGLVQPRWLRPLFVGWMVAVFPIGWTVSQLILIVVFFGVFLLVGCVLRWCGHDPLQLGRTKKDSYWKPKLDPTDLRRYFRQY